MRRREVLGGAGAGTALGLVPGCATVPAPSPQAPAEPAVPLRAIKFNLPYMSYRKGGSLSLHDATIRDPAYWRAFLSMMADNGFNALTLWSLHPFHYLVKTAKYPEASPFSDGEMADWHGFWTELFGEAKVRGIRTFLVNWNTFVSPQFAEAHDVAKWSIDWSHFGPGTDSELVKDYTREVVGRTIAEYPDLTGLGITLGERMGGQTAEERRQWLDETFFAAIAAAPRPIEFLYRAPLSADTKSGGSTSIDNDRATRAQIERLENVVRPVHVSCKFNWSHGHSATKLYHVHGGELSDAYWNPPPTGHDVLWTIRNEDFFTLRWGDPDFVREHIARNTPEYVGGYIVGSEAYIPATDYFTKPGVPKDWRWAFERQWLFYAVWGRLLYDPNTPIHVFIDMFAERFGAARAQDLFDAWRLASRMPLDFARYYKGTNDPSLYTEGHFSWFENRPDVEFISVDRLINRPVLDTDSLWGAREWVEAGEPVGGTRQTPLQFAAALDRRADRIMGLVEKVRAVHGVTPKLLEPELADLEAWSWHGRHFGHQLAGAVALVRFRKTGKVNFQDEAIMRLTAASQAWAKLAEAVHRYNVDPVPLPSHFAVSWTKLQAAADADIVIARNAVPALQDETDTRGFS
ncbi:hypothetical protein A6F68_00812 [Tsuneonella dongtanensis]|uniref:Uncharacterized protein n=2 Tax=Tsuneonella dongtanensis TaxID=692370 RepID=A0A1B2AB88_9SPHN|nr:hypothetical protein A6F68_00812 [Tsuneonella dongtanensis]